MARALLIHGGALGDSVLALRVAVGLRRGGYDVAVMGRAAMAWLARRAGFERVTDVDSAAARWLFGPGEPATDWRTFDVVVDMLGATHAEKGLGAGGRVVVVESRLRAGWDRHVTEQWLIDLRSAGVAVAELGANEGLLGGAELAMGDSGPVLIHPGSGGRWKCWPVGRFVELVDALRAGGSDVQVVLGEVELETWEVADLGAIRRVAPTVECRSLSDLAERLLGARRVIGNDSGVSHLAAALGRPTLAIFGVTDPRNWRPLGALVTTVGGKGGFPTVDEVKGAFVEI